MQVLDDSGRDPIDDLLFDQDARSGGFYELAFQLGPRDDMRLQMALSELVAAAQILGPWTVTASPARPADRASWTVHDLEAGHHLSGVVQLRHDVKTLCSVFAAREEDGDDWLELCLPLGSLSRTEPRIGAFPFGDDGERESLVWRSPIDDWLARIGIAVYASVNFRLAAIGFEVPATVDAESVASGLPDDRPFGLILPGEPPQYLPATT